MSHWGSNVVEAIAVHTHTHTHTHTHVCVCVRVCVSLGLEPYTINPGLLGFSFFKFMRFLFFNFMKLLPCSLRPLDLSMHSASFFS